MPHRPHKQPNILVICSDEHHPRLMGHAGHPIVQTPNLDRLAARGTSFRRAYCNSPVCSPSRMSFITGKYVHQIDTWMIGYPLSRDEMTWARRLDQAGIPSTMLGKMDFCGDYQDGGFTHHRILRQRPALPHIPRPQPDPSRLADYQRPDKRMHLMAAGPRTSSHISDGGFGDEQDDTIGNYDHDRIVTDWTLQYLQEKGSQTERQPWACYVGLLMPHWPFCAPRETYSLYYPDNVELPVDFQLLNAALHPANQHFQEALALGKITDETLRRTLAAYYGMITSMDAMVGEILDELERQDMLDSTYIIYTSDHGESLGEHGLFYKQCSYEGSVGVPLILAGPDLQRGATMDAPVSLVDMYPTILEMAGLACESDRPGESWLPLAKGGGRTLNHVFAEFHGNFFMHDWYMLVENGMKYTHYTDERPSLYQLDDDPHELNDLAKDPCYASHCQAFDARLRSITDPDATARRAKRAMGLIGPDGEDYTKTSRRKVGQPAS